MNETKTWQGSCHCGRIAYEVQGTPERVTECNCSICRRKGIKMWFVPRTQLHVHTPETDIATYTFDKHSIKHRFCPVCGIHVFGESSKDGVAMAAINARCLEDIDLDALPVQHFDGRSL